jgi:hypothetical protein
MFAAALVVSTYITNRVVPQINVWETWGLLFQPPVSHISVPLLAFVMFGVVVDQFGGG